MYKFILVCFSSLYLFLIIESANSTTYSHSFEDISIEVNTETLFKELDIGNLILLSSEPTCSSSEYNCSCAEGQCCAVTSEGCYCQNCENGDEDESGGSDLLIWILKVMVAILT